MIAIRITSMQSEEELDADPLAERALNDCALAALISPWLLQHAEKCILFGKSAFGKEGEIPWLSDLQKRRVRQWHKVADISIKTRARLAASYIVASGDPPDEEGKELRAIASRAMPSTPCRGTGLTSFDTRIRAAEIAARWTGMGSDTLKALTERWPAPEHVYTSFDAALRKLIGGVHSQKRVH
jgi:hypothetical protein